MKTLKEFTAKESFKLAKLLFRKGYSILILTLIIVVASCTKGLDGRDGRAFLSVSWDVDVPDFIDVGNPHFPPSFYYGEFYRVYPGHYFMYYEGEFWNGYDWVPYAWDVDYEIWENRGEPGGYNYNGRDGLDNYFTLRCTPYGPYTYHLKSIVDENRERIVTEEDDAIIIKEEMESFTIRVTYKKVEPKSEMKRKN